MTDMFPDCERTLELLPLHVGGDLEPTEAVPLERHLSECDSCREALARAALARRLLFEALASEAAEGESSEVDGRGRSGASLWQDLRPTLLAEGLLGSPARQPSEGGQVRGGERARAAGLPHGALGQGRGAIQGPRAGARELSEARIRWAGGRGPGAYGRVLALSAALLVLVSSAGLFLALMDSERSPAVPVAGRSPEGVAAPAVEALATGLPGSGATPEAGFLPEGSLVVPGDVLSPAPGGLRPIRPEDRLRADPLEPLRIHLRPVGNERLASDQ